MSDLDDLQSRQQLDLPAQRAAHHDTVVPTDTSMPADVPMHRQWHTRVSAVRQGVFLGSIVLLGTGLVVAAVFRTPAAAIFLGVTAMLFVIARAALGTQAPRTVTLDGSMLTVQHEGITSQFNLAEPNQPIELQGTPGTGSWQMVLIEPTGLPLSLGRDLVDSEEMTRIVTYYRGIAQHIADQRRYRHGRDCQ